MALDPIGTIAAAIKEGFVLVGQILKNRPRAHREAAIEAAENYIFVDEKSGKYSDIDDERQKDLKIHFRKRFFRWN